MTLFTILVATAVCLLTALLSPRPDWVSCVIGILGGIAIGIGIAAQRTDLRDKDFRDG